MQRREFITILGGTAITWPLAVRAQQPERMRRIGVLQYINKGDPELQRRISVFVQGLQKLGWREGTNLVIDYRYGAEDSERIRLDAAELVGLKPDVIWTSGGLGLLTLKRATHSIPIVFSGVYDPVGSGYVASLARPGGNITGFTLGEFSMGGKMLEALKEVVPQVSRVAVILNLEQPPHVAMWRAIEAIAQSFGVSLIATDVQDPAEIERAIEALAHEPNGGLIVLPGPITNNHSRTDYRASGPAPPSCGLPVSVFRHKRWPGVVWRRPLRPIPASGSLRRSHPQGGKAERLTGATTHQIRAGH